MRRACIGLSLVGCVGACGGGDAGGDTSASTGDASGPGTVGDPTGTPSTDPGTDPTAGPTGDPDTGVETSAGADTGPPPDAPLDERLSVVDLVVPEGVAPGANNWRIWGTGPLNVAPVFTVPLSTCETLVGYTLSLIHISEPTRPY